MKKPRILISGGGTGGHVFPAIAIADQIKKLEPEAEILFVGAEGKLEMQKVPNAGYQIEGLPIRGFQRKLTWQNLSFPFKLLTSLWRARGIVKRFKPDVAVGVGGYASGPTLQMAGRAGVPTLLQEQNSYAGVTNKLLAKKARKVCVAYANMEHFFTKEKIVLTGNPVREVIRNLSATRAEGIAHFGLEEHKKTIFIFGGSLGARTINEAVEAAGELLANREDIQVLWQAGKLYISEFAQSKTAQLSNVHIKQFIDRMDLAYAAADVIIGRAGALTISELCLVGKPSILVPSPNVAEDHQTKNAQALVDQSAAIMVRDQVAKEEMIPKALELLDDADQAATFAANIKKMAKPNAAADIANEVLALVNA